MVILRGTTMQNPTALCKKFRRNPAGDLIRIVKWTAPNKVAVVIRRGSGFLWSCIENTSATLLGAAHFTKTRYCKQRIWRLTPHAADPIIIFNRRRSYVNVWICSNAFHWNTLESINSFLNQQTSFPNPYQRHLQMNPKSFQHSIKFC